MKLKHKLVPISELIRHYNIKKVEKLCSNCDNYNKIWSCPPHEFDQMAYLLKFKYVHVISAKIILNKEEFKEEYKEQVIDVFQGARREFGDLLMNLEKEHENSESLIAGNCYQCSTCKRLSNEPCIFDKRRRYSPESLGLLVSSMTSDILEQEIKWVKDGIPDYLLTVGALLVNEESLLKI